MALFLRGVGLGFFGWLIVPTFVAVVSFSVHFLTIKLPIADSSINYEEMGINRLK